MARDSDGLGKASIAASRQAARPRSAHGMRVLVCLMAVVALVGAPACNRPASRGAEALPVAEKTGVSRPAVDDETVSRLVKSALGAHRDLVDSHAIGVKTHQGQVTLSGKVPAEQIERAEEIARAVEGVRDVDNRLRPTGILA